MARRSPASAFQPSVRGRLLLLVAVMAVPALLLVTWAIAQMYQRDREAIEQQLVTDAHSASRLLEAYLESRQALLHGLAASQALADGDMGLFLGRARTAVSRPEAWVALFDPAGQQLINTHEAPAGDAASAAFLPEFRQQAAAGRTWVSNLHHCERHDHHQVFVGIPVTVQGTPGFTLAYGMTPEGLNELLRAIRSPHDRIVALTDRSQRVVARNRRADEFVGMQATPRLRAHAAQVASAVFEDVSLEGDSSVVAYYTSDASGWTVVVAAPGGEAFALARSLLTMAAGVSAASILVAGLLALWLGRGVLRSVQRLVQMAERFGQGGDLPPVDTGMVETNQVAEALRAASAQLGEHEAQLSRSRDEAVAASRAKDEFLAALSHELRTPLNPVLLTASDAAANPDLTIEQARAALAMVSKNVALEARLIDDLLDLTRISRGLLRIDPQLVDAHAVLRDALGTVELETAEKRLQISVFASAPRRVVTADPARLQQVFWNLLKNATKFTPASGRIELRTSNPSPDTFALMVHDSGIGMTTEELATCFHSFSQGGHRLGGLGLGLSICHELLRLMGGTIRAESAGRGSGATFVVTLPAAQAELSHATVVELTPSAGGPGGERLLLVEDHEPSRQALARALRRRGHEVVTAGTVAEGLSQATLHEIAWVISDIGLPDGDGYALMQQLRTLRPTIRGLAISGYGMDEDIRRGQAAGFAGHLVKPVNVDDLDSALRRLRQPVNGRDGVPT